MATGRLADMLGRRRIIILGLVGFGMLSGVCRMAQSETWLIGARIAQGIGAALIFPIATGRCEVTSGRHSRRYRQQGMT
jgi:MFS family permease